MTELHWQKSTYSQEASACVYLATTPTGTILIRESNESATILTTGRRQLGALIFALRADQCASIAGPPGTALSNGRAHRGRGGGVLGEVPDGGDPAEGVEVRPRDRGRRAGGFTLVLTSSDTGRGRSGDVVVGSSAQRVTSRVGPPGERHPRT